MLGKSFDTSQKTRKVSDAKRNGLMLFREIIAVYSKNVIQHILRTNCYQFLIAFRRILKMRKASVVFVMSVCKHGIPGPLLDRFS
jgi:hypothetical protein